MKRLIALAILIAATALPVSADTGYFIVKGYSYPEQVVAGPYADFARCARIAAAYGVDYHCMLKVY